MSGSAGEVERGLSGERKLASSNHGSFILRLHWLCQGGESLMNPVIRAQLKEFIKYHSLPPAADDSNFEVYSIFSVMSGLLGESVDPLEVHLKGNEFGLDGVGILIQGEIVKNARDVSDKISTIKNPSIEFVFFQSKTSASFDYGDVSKFFDAIDYFFDESLKGESPEIDDLIRAKSEIYDKSTGRRNPKISCYYISTGNYEKPAKLEKLRSEFRAKLEQSNIFDNKTIAVEFIGAADLQEWYRAATSAIEVDIDFPKSVVMPNNKNVEEAYIGYIDAKNLLRLYTIKDDNGSVIGVNRLVFFDNIRDYDDKSKINVSIKDSVFADGGAEFVFRNNGITVVSKSIDRTGDKFKLEDYQIVNGCQTSNIIYDLVYGEEGPGSVPRTDLAETIQVPLRLIGSRDDEFVSSIIVGTNRQNPVRDEQFWALRPFMKSLEEYCRSLDAEEAIYLERRDNQYRDSDVERTRIMQPQILMKAIAACLLFQPHRAARDYRGILTEYENTIFLDDHDVRVYHAVSYLYYRLEFLWRNQRISSESKTFRYYILAAIGIRMTSNSNVFSLKKSKISGVASSIVALCRNEETFKEEVESVLQVIDEQLAKLGVSGQERIRDAIRSDAFAVAFRDRVVASLS
ncbi:AIPR family protein [Xanthobacter versatilis]|uniref:AIPR family protein n=1 Tax=Xanthobacter autotrophicus (strain ATCC BAA-1158 / Py2) TaxID=78245 RepID=UPI00372CB7B5